MLSRTRLGYKRPWLETMATVNDKINDYPGDISWDEKWTGSQLVPHHFLIWGTFVKPTTTRRYLMRHDLSARRLTGMRSKAAH